MRVQSIDGWHMPKDFPRSLRVGEQIRRELTILIREAVKDPRVADFSISEVIVSQDLSNAKIFYSPYSDHPDIEGLQAGLQSSAAFMRKELGKILRMRSIPQLAFYYDDTEERSARLEKLLEQQHSSDSKD